jgi:hypothetical protein
MQPATFLNDLEFEFQRLKRQADRALAQVGSEELFQTLDPDSNSLAMLMKHLAGNMRSRWTDFLTTDGDKPNRNRDSEFITEGDTPESLKQDWEVSWRLLFEGLKSLRPEDLDRSVRIRGEHHSVPQAILRQMTHHASHIGQIVFLAKHLVVGRWQTLSIPRGQSEQYNARMRQQHAEGYRSGKV